MPPSSLPAASVAIGNASPYMEDIREVPLALRPKCDDIVIDGARSQLALVALVLTVAGFSLPVAGPIAIAFGLCLCVPIAIFSERIVVSRLVLEGISPQLARQIARGGRVAMPEDARRSVVVEPSTHDFVNVKPTEVAP